MAAYDEWMPFAEVTADALGPRYRHDVRTGGRHRARNARASLKRAVFSQLIAGGGEIMTPPGDVHYHSG